MDLIFKALADQNRRRMLDRLHDEPGLTLTELVRDLSMTRQSASRHVSILESAGLIVTYWSGREKLHYLNPIPVVEITRRVGTSAATFYHYFEDVEEAALALAEQAAEEMPALVALIDGSWRGRASSIPREPSSKPSWCTGIATTRC